MILVTGATGTVGGRVLRRLREEGRPVRAVTRDPARAAFPGDVSVAACDLDVPSGLDEALDGVDRVFLMSLGHHKATHDTRVVAAARKAGVVRIVQLSSLGVEEVADRQDNPLARWHREAEEALCASGMEWTVLRPGGFMSNALSWADSVRTEGVARGPVADMPEAVVHPEDIAEVAVRALTDDGLVGETVALSGPESLTPRAQAAVLADMLGRDIRFESVPLAVHRQKMLAKYSAETVDGVLAALADVLAGGDDLRAHVLPGVERVLGRPARTFTRWVCENLHEFR